MIMKTIKSKFLIFFLLITPVFMWADDKRAAPLDLYLILDASEGLRTVMDEVVAWINDEVIDRLIQEGDRIVIWSAGASSRIIHTETVTAQKDEIKEIIRTLETSGRTADFGSALREAASRASSENSPGRMNMTMLISSSAETLAPVLESGNTSLLRWSRVKVYSRWRALVVAPGINDRVRQAAAAYMRGI